MTKKCVVVGMSGGVDSAVSAKLLLDQGFDVISVFMKNWDEDSPECTATEDALAAMHASEKLGIPFHCVNFAKEYWRDVFEYFLKENRVGRTPNPDILCNKFIKFKSFIEKADEFGADFIAMGHYAKKVWNEKTQKFELHIPTDKEKDQTYFLYTLDQAQLSRVLFPLEDLKKSEVRKIARKAGFENAEKKDSTGICFIGERNYMQFLQKFLEKNPGKIVTPEGQKVGGHEGLSFYTLGQRKNLGVGGVKDFSDAPWFVVKKDFKKNKLVVSQNEDLLLGTSLRAHKLNWISGKSPAQKFKCEAKIRYRGESSPCIVECRGASQCACTFKKPVRAIAPGQSVVFYDGEVCLGGGEIL